jgi:PAS domain S-box-containing protein
MNPFALISLFAFVVYVIIGTLAWVKNSKSNLNRIFIIFCVLAAYAAFSEFGYRQATDSETAFLWIKIMGFRPIAFAAMVHVVLIFTEQKKFLKNAFTYVALYGPALAIGFLWQFTPLFVTGVVKQSWGWVWEPSASTATKIALLWSFTLTITSLYFVWRYFACNEGTKRQQAKTIASGLTIAAVISIGADAILPILSVRSPGSTTAAMAIGGLFILFAIWRYDLLTLTPATASEEIIATMSDYMFLVNPEGKITRVNATTIKVTGYQFDEIVGKTITSVLFTEKPENLLKLPPQSGAGDIETTLKIKTNQIIPVSVSASAVINAKNILVGYVYIARNISERKLVQEKLQTMLESEKTMRQDLEHEIKKRADFTRALVHELMTPLTAIIASSELLEDKIGDDIWTGITDNIRWSSLILQKRINDLLDLSKGEMGMLKLEPTIIDPSELFLHISKNMAPVLSKNRQTIGMELQPCLPKFSADEDRILQILFNLIDNASKYSGKGGKIILKALNENNFLVVSIHDSGPGISKEEQKQLFNPYTRLGVDKRRVGGIGLGLAISKTLVELHGGQIWVESEKEKGSTFTFTIPIKTDQNGI